MAMNRSQKPHVFMGKRVSGHASGTLLTPKSSIQLGCWNVRSLGNPTRQNERLCDVLRTMKEKSVEVLALSEVRWPGHGVSQLEDTIIAHSDMSDRNSHQRSRGVAVLLSDSAASAWRSAGSVFHPVSERILRIRLKSHIGFMSLIAVYAPTNVPGNEEETEAFYQSLQSVVEQVPVRDMLLIMGDFNARVGNDMSAWIGTLGRFGPAERNENGVKLLDFCALKGLVITNTLFQHRACHQHTWFHPAESSNAVHVLDYVLVNQRFKTSILDTRVYRKTHLQSDHRLVISKVRLKLKAKRRRVQREPRYQVDPRCLEDQQVEEFRRVLAGELEAEPKGDV